MRKKLKDSGGLTMVETLCAVAILVLLCLMMNTGIHMAVTNYRALTSESETRLLLSSLSDALADKLRYCVVYVDESGAYESCFVGGVRSEDAIKVDDNHRLKVTVKDPDGGPGAKKDVDLLPEGAYGNPDGFYKGDYQVTMGSAMPEGADPAALKETYQKDTNSFAIKLTVQDVNLGITKTTELSVRCLNPVKKEGPEP